jgi:hypothetical protein
MKKIIPLFLFCLMLSGDSARAGLLPPNYIRMSSLLGGSGPYQINPGFIFAPGSDIPQTLGGSEVPLLMHSHEDGHLLLPNEDYALLAVGAAGSIGGGRFLVLIGPTFNVAPAGSAMLLAALNTLSPTGFWNLKTHLMAMGTSSSDAGLCLGPKFAFDSLQNFKGYFMVFAGGWLKFGAGGK